MLSLSSRTRRFLLLFGSLSALLLSAAPANARPPYKKALVDFLGLPNASKLNDCRVCHLPEPSGKENDPLAVERSHNVFGARLKAVRAELRKADKKYDIVSALLAIADEDCDGDGVPNLLELVSGHFPGDATDKPTDAELETAKKKLAVLLKNLNAYPWRPFETVKRPPVPVVKNKAWVRNPIDAFIAAEHEKQGLKPRPEAAKATLLRRVYFDLSGLPPTPEELHAFLNDESPDAYEKMVDRLLASPRYGERWGRHWMDVWRYSDWAGWGQQVRDSQPHIWHWRDWIIESLNADKSYERMVLEMLAADEMAPEDTNALRATGYLVRNYKLLSREKWMQDTVEHTSLAFLGVTLGCARCHDHMYDPLLQKEYYQVRAIFETHQVRIDRLRGELDVTKNGLPRVYDANLTAPTYLFIRGDDRTPDKTPLPPGVPEALGGVFQPVTVTLPPAAYAPERREFVVKELLAVSAANVTKTKQALAAAKEEARPRAELDATLAAAQHEALTMLLHLEELEEAGNKDMPEWKQTAMDTLRQQRQVAVLEAQRNLLAAKQAQQAGAKDAAKKVADAEKALAKAEADAKLPDGTAFVRRNLPVYSQTSTGRRLAFAKWIANRDNPLAARVAVNHIWLRHFGQAIVPSVFDFGRNGRPPSHPALLDWLAVEFMDNGWSMKKLHKFILMSNTYRLASTPDETALALDRDNKYLWRMSSRRLEAEVVRDCVFYVAGRLDLTMGGPDLDHMQGLTIPRRSLYFRHAAEKEMEFLKLFDSASVTECYQRKESILPQQALALSNSEMTLRHSRILARTLHDQNKDEAAFVTAAFERMLSRAPTREEEEACAEFLAEQTKRHAADKTPPAPLDKEGRTPATDPARRARENLVHTLMNHNDFVTIR